MIPIQFAQVPITYCPVPFYKSASDATVVVRPGCQLYTCSTILSICCVRRMPVVLPHDLVSTLASQGCWPGQLGAMEDLKAWWDHVGRHSEWHCEHPAFDDQTHEPLVLYGDDACLTKQGNEKMVCITLHHSLDKRRNSMKSSWPLCIFRCVPWLNWWLQQSCAYYIYMYAVKTSLGYLDWVQYLASIYGPSTLDAFISFAST